MQTKPFYIKIPSPFSILVGWRVFLVRICRDLKVWYFRPETQGHTWPPWPSGCRTTSTPASTTSSGSWRTSGWPSGATRLPLLLPCPPCLPCPDRRRPTPTPTILHHSGLRKAIQTALIPSTIPASTRWVSLLSQSVRYNWLRSSSHNWAASSRPLFQSSIKNPNLSLRSSL